MFRNNYVFGAIRQNAQLLQQATDHLPFLNMSSERSGVILYPASLENNADVQCLKARADTGDDCCYSAIAPSINQKSNQDNSLTQVRGHEIILLFVVAMMSTAGHFAVSL